MQFGRKPKKIYFLYPKLKLQKRERDAFGGQVHYSCSGWERTVVQGDWLR